MLGKAPELVQEHTLNHKFMRHTGDTGTDNDMRTGAAAKFSEWRILQENGLVPSINTLKVQIKTERDSGRLK